MDFKLKFFSKKQFQKCQNIKFVVLNLILKTAGHYYYFIKNKMILTFKNCKKNVFPEISKSESQKTKKRNKLPPPKSVF